jgi:hypothetical protein
MTYEQEVIIKCAIKGTLGGLDKKMTSEELDELPECVTGLEEALSD